jgi:F-type H+-transporting ATPase subunit b
MRFKKLAAIGALTFLGIAAPAITTAASARPATAVQTAVQTAEIGHAEEDCIKALENGEPLENCQKAPNPILPATGELLYGSIAFLCIFLMLWKFAIPAMKKAMDARTNKIEGDLKAAESARAEADKQLADYKAQLADAKAESGRIIDEARQQAEAVRKDLIGRAEADAAQVRAKATEDLNAQAERIKADLSTHVRSLSIELAEKVVGQNLDRGTNEALVDRYIADLAK